MNDYRSFLKELISMPGLSGYEDPVRERIQERWRSSVDDLWVSPLGSLHGLKRGKKGAIHPKILIATHMDAVGMMVTKVQDSFLRFTSIGGLDSRVLPYQPVVVHGRKDIPGVIACPTDRHLLKEFQRKSVPISYLFIDTGIASDELKGLVRPGDFISFGNKPVELDTKTIMGHTLDNRASVTALTVCLELLQDRIHMWDIVAVATVQEEIGLKGARTSGFAEKPDLAIAVDVGFSKEPGASGFYLLEQGSGPALGWGPVINPVLYGAVEGLAKKMSIPVTKEINPGGRTGTDADALSLTSEGIPTLVISIPLKFMHSPTEIVQCEDIYQTGRILAEFISVLDEEFMDTLIPDDLDEEI
ncbi:MAG: M20/M25/M40 family metallo-hydrolase [Anaerolineaceae bacterium]|nr:M20/M25/M40 family metallo-hydrolase [Anaerolineaceae bacterium]